MLEFMYQQVDMEAENRVNSFNMTIFASAVPLDMCALLSKTCAVAAYFTQRHVAL